MVTETSESGVLRFPETIQKIPERDRPLVGAFIRVLEPVHAFYLEQKRQGFYGGLLVSEPLPPGGDSPYTIIKEVEGEQRSLGYNGVEPFNRLVRQIASRMEEVVRVAEETQDPERGLIEDTLRSQAQAFREGNFERATTSSLNTRIPPRYHFYVGLLDRYLDPDRGIKLAMQGWLQSRDEAQHIFLNDIARQILREQSYARTLRLFVGDMLAAAGMAADRPWAGNTVPSEDNIRKQVGADSYIFINNMDLRVETTLIPAMKRYLPQVTQIPGWEESMPRATYIGITAHEAGHSRIPFDEQTASLLGGRYMAFKELMSEESGFPAVTRLPRGVIPPSLRQLIIARSLVQWRSFIDEYAAETDPDKKTILLPYALAGEWRLNTQERGGGIRVNDNGVMVVEDWDRVVEADEQLYQELNSIIRNERYQRGFVDRFIRLNSRVPKSYFPHNPHNRERPSVIGSGNTESVPFQPVIS